MKVKRDMDIVVPNITKAEEEKISVFCSTLGLFTYLQKAKKE
ncbi:MAG: hypothetical protein Q8M94_18130 [Ignavibacteria bacterium]|nr:hypothetical protein [Ignavibacteria bacterium]